MATILTAYLSLLLGAVLLVAGVLARRKGREHSDYLLVGGGILVIIGLALLGGFLSAFR